MAKSNTGISLNDAQYVGPAIQEDLLSILIRLRQYQYVLIADIIRMYRQVLIAEKHHMYQLIFCHESEMDPLDIFQLNTATYGQALAPYLAVRNLNQVYDIEKTNPIIAEIIRRDFYIDDLLAGSDSIEDIIQDLIKVLKSRGFELSKWCTNSSQKLLDENLGCPRQGTHGTTIDPSFPMEKNTRNIQSILATLDA